MDKTYHLTRAPDDGHRSLGLVQVAPGPPLVLNLGPPHTVCSPQHTAPDNLPTVLCGRSVRALTGVCQAQPSAPPNVASPVVLLPTVGSILLCPELWSSVEAGECVWLLFLFALLTLRVLSTQRRMELELFRRLLKLGSLVRPSG
jgi:hypothetical protein